MIAYILNEVIHTFINLEKEKKCKDMQEKERKRKREEFEEFFLCFCLMFL